MSKILIDEMPVWHDDCPFNSDSICKIDNYDCHYVNYQGDTSEREPENCEYLTTKRIEIGD